MIEYEKLKQNLLVLAKLEITLEGRGGPESNVRLYDQIYALKEGILQSFGLPGTPENDNLVFFTQIPTNIELDERAEQLKKAAEKYLLSSPESDLQILTEGRDAKSNPFAILPLLKVTPHAYTLFVYNQILLQGKDSVENVLHELKLANQSAILGTIGNLEQGNMQNPDEQITRLKGLGIKYIDDFLRELSIEKAKANSDSLLRFLSELNHKGQFTTNEQFFDSLTYNLMNNLCIVVGRNAYRVTECEIYYMDSAHPDPYTHCGDEQLTSGHLYLNKTGGLDITFGNPNGPAWGGILIRGMRNLGTNEYINNPRKVVEEIFKGLGNIIVNQNPVYLAELQPGKLKIETPLKTTRVELNREKHDPGNFYEKLYRYIVELVPPHKFLGKQNLIEQLLAEKKMTEEQAKEILGYPVK